MRAHRWAVTLPRRGRNSCRRPAGLVDADQRGRARRKPHQATTLKALERGASRGEVGRPLRDLSDVAGRWVDDPAANATLRARHRVAPESTSPKAVALDAIAALPTRSSWDEILEQLYVRQKIEAGIADADSERVISQRAVRRRFSRPR